MMRNVCFKKGLVVGIIVILIGISFIPIAGSQSRQKQAIHESLPLAYTRGGESGISLVNIKVVGETDGNNWYGSDNNFTFTYESDEIAEIYYGIDGNWNLYTEMFNVSDSGVHILEWYAVDYEGNKSDVDGPFSFKIDQTPPKIILLYEILGGNPLWGWEFSFLAEATDTMSGMERVEFYLGDVLQETFYGPGPQYEWIVIFPRGLRKKIKAIAFDNIGNSDYASVDIVNIAVLESSLLHMDISEESRINGCLDDVLLSEIGDGKNHRIDEKLPSISHTRGVFDPAYVIVSFNRKMGTYGWIVSNVSIPIFYESDRIDEVYYQINDGGWILYNEPLVISDGIYVFSWYVVDSEGYTSTSESISFKIDQTIPEINLKKERLSENEVKFIANVSDELSGIDRVEFHKWAGDPRFVDYDFPYECIWIGSSNENVTATVYDKAGNSNSRSMYTRSCRHSQQSSNPLFLRFLESFSLLERLLNVLRWYTE